MSNPSRIAMLAKVREAVGDDIRAADRAVSDGKNGSTVWEERILGRACRDDETLSCLIAGQRPSTAQDLLSLMVAITDVSDLLLDAASGEPDVARLRKLVGLVEMAAGNAALFLDQATEPHTEQERRTVSALRARFHIPAAATGGEA
jgi:hypothetical protein